MSSLTALINQRRFVVADTRTKEPVDPFTGKLSNAQDASTWMLPADALAWAMHLGSAYGVGVVISEGCGFVCIDIDHALQDDGTWSPIALQLCERFKGAYIEVSVSGRGLHIICHVRGVIAEHRCRNAIVHIEAYSRERYILITGTNAYGSPFFDCTDAWNQTLAEYLPTPIRAKGGFEWTREPVPEWSGPDNDDELIRRMLNDRRPSVLFGSKVSIRDLYEGNADTLSRAFPTSTPGKAYDASAADLSLANAAIWWTGGDCERTLRVMQHFALRRDKWDRQDYIVGTILKAADARKGTYRQSGAPAAPIAELAPPPAAKPASETTVTPSPPATPLAAAPETGRGQIIGVAGQIVLFEGCVYVEDVKLIMVPNGNLLDREQFDTNPRYRGRKYLADTDGAPTDSAFDCFTASQCWEFAHVRGCFFSPLHPPGAIVERDGETWINTYRKLEIPSAPGSVAPFLEHIRKLLPNGDDALILLCYMAACVQYKGYKSRWALFIQGTPGNGKSLLSDAMKYCIGQRYSHDVRASQLGSRFNAMFYGKLLSVVEDVKITEDKAGMWEALKPMISQTTMEIEGKGVDQVTREVCNNFILNSNHKDGLRKEMDDRRICPLFCAQQLKSDKERDGLDAGYFVRYWQWFNAGGAAHVLHYLERFEIDSRYNFAGACIEAPRTTSTDAAINAGLGAIEQEILEAISAKRPGFKGGWLSSTALQILLDESGRARYLAPTKKREIIESLGYEPHPSLPDGRVTTAMTDGNRPRLYVARGHSSLMVDDPGAIKALYEAAQRAV